MSQLEAVIAIDPILSARSDRPLFRRSWWWLNGREIANHFESQRRPEFLGVSRVLDQLKFARYQGNIHSGGGGIRAVA
ncbi:hypothetical protein [Nocardia crassostreae]|uniref:hypothetical protein n=1 Tax=Nocardia crassostreae TaxID=53428 RepID=UPI000834EC25|nr:hypothetical protein [Nocardia crassostreae]